MFAVEVPLGSVRVKELQHANTQQFATEHAGVSILFIDDDPSILDAIKMLLRLDGFHVSTATNGKLALKLIEHDGLKPNIILSDYSLPGETGVELVQQIRRKLGFEIPAIILTGDTSQVAFKAA